MPKNKIVRFCFRALLLIERQVVTECSHSGAFEKNTAVDRAHSLPEEAGYFLNDAVDLHLCHGQVTFFV